MTVLVTGGAGYIGSHMVLALVACRERVSCSTSSRASILRRARVPLVCAIRRPESVATIISDPNRGDHHFAASSWFPLVQPTARLLHNNTVIRVR